VTASKGWALVVGFILFGLLIGGGVAWRRSHPAEAPVALATNPAPSTGSTSATSPAATPPAATATADRGPLPPSAPNPDTASAPTDAQGAMTSASADPAKDPHFDVVRVEPSGETVLAGKGAPNADVALVASGKVVGTARADANGHFVILPPALKPGSYDLSLRQTPPGKPAAESSQSVAVSVPERGKGPVVVALAEPGKATRLLSSPPAAADPARPDTAPSAKTDDPAKTEDAAKTGNPGKTEQSTAPVAEVKFAIRSVDLENGTGLFASGTAQPGTAVHLYLNDSHVADVVAGADGQWTVKVRKGLTGGHYMVRADAMSAAGSVSARAEVPFDVPMAMAEAPSPFTAPNLEDGAASSTEDPRPRPDIVAAARSATPADAKPAMKPDTAPATPAKADASARAPAAAPAAVAATAEAPVKAPTADAVVDEIRTALVVTGDNLWNISRARLGQGTRYTQIYAANAGQIRDPKLIYPGQIFVVPHQ
jgi:nucleoid-associated protein YgaU